MTYSEFVSQFQIYDNPPYKEGFERHHIVPVSQQIEADNRCIYVTPAQHMWLHILYDRENNTKTASWFLGQCGKPSEFFTCYELCLEWSKKREETIRKSIETCKTIEFRQACSERNKGERNPRYGKHHTEESKKKMSNSNKGKNTWTKGSKWYNNGVISVMALECPEGFAEGRLTQNVHWFNNGVKSVMAYECPKGFVPGRLKRT